MLRKALDKPTGDENHAELEERLRRLEEVTFGGVGR